MDEGQGWCGLLKGLVPRVVVAMYEDNTLKKFRSSLRTATATPPELSQYLYIFFQKEKKSS
jgi:hypothetical protein